MLPVYPRKSDAVLLPCTLLLSLGLSACSSFSSSAVGEFGATPGGVKDLGPARELVKNGQVPPPESFLVEAMFSEHDLPLSGAPCSDALCLRGAAGIAPTLDAEPAGWAQLGLSSNVDPDKYQRPAITAVFCVDVSGSMGWDHKGVEESYPTPARLSYLLLKKLATQLGPQDRVALVTYGSSVDQPLALTAGGDPALLTAIERLDTHGSTNMEAGLKRAYEVARGADHATSEVRIFLFTDENPNVGATSSSEFSRIVADGATAGTSLTIFGMGLGVRQDLMNEMAHLRGANAYTLAQETDVPKLITESWPWMASPLAYDLKVNLTPATGFYLTQTYGFPGTADKTAALDVSTVFLSRKRGALLLQLAPTTGVALTSLALSGTLDFKRPDGTPVSRSLRIDAAGATLDDRGMYFAQPSVAKSVALAVLVSAMKEAATIYGTDPGKAVTRMTAALSRITADNKALADATLEPEVQLAANLLGLMQMGAPQGNLYGQ